MKVILLKDVARLGRKSEVKDVPIGHAQNLLIPKKLAIPATPENLKRLSAEISKQSEAEAQSAQTFKEAIEGLAGEQVTYTVEANNRGHLFRGVNARDVAEAIKARGFQIEEDDIHLEHPIKSTGIHGINLSRGSHQGTCTLHIVGKQ